MHKNDELKKWDVINNKYCKWFSFQEFNLTCIYSLNKIPKLVFLWEIWDFNQIKNCNINYS